VSMTIAHVGPDLPQRLLRATGRHAGPIAFDAERTTPHADRWMESKFAPWAKAILESWAAGEYEAHSHVVFSRGDDSAQRLYYYVCELQRRGALAGPEALILDIAKVPRESSVTHTVRCLRNLAGKLDVTPEQLGAVGPGDAKTAEEAASPACLLTGTPPPDRRLHEAVEGAGFSAIGPTLPQSWCLLDDPIDRSLGNPFETLARQIHAAPNGPRAFGDSGARLLGQIETHGAVAAILWQIEEDEAQAWHLPAQRAALDSAGLPSLVLTRRDWLARDGAGEEIAEFLTEIAR